MPTTALLVIDLQRGAFDGMRCPPVDSPDRLIRNACTLVQAARGAEAPVFFVQHCEGAGEPFEEGTSHWQLHESLVPGQGEPVVGKRASSSFEGTDLDAQLKERGVTGLVLCGLQSEFCVSNTARSALELGYTVRVAEDGHGTWPSEGRTAAEIARRANADLREAGAIVEPTASLVATLRKAPA